MFFIEKGKIGTVLGTQKEYAASERRGIHFFSEPNANAATEPHSASWHYLWPAALLEPSLRAPFETNPNVPAPTCYIWSQDVAEGELVGEPFVRPLPSECVDWQEEARNSFTVHKGGTPAPAVANSAA